MTEKCIVDGCQSPVKYIRYLNLNLNTKYCERHLTWTFRKKVERTQNEKIVNEIKTIFECDNDNNCDNSVFSNFDSLDSKKVIKYQSILPKLDTTQECVFKQYLREHKYPFCVKNKCVNIAEYSYMSTEPRYCHKHRDNEMDSCEYIEYMEKYVF